MLATARFSASTPLSTANVLLPRLLRLCGCWPLAHCPCATWPAALSLVCESHRPPSRANPRASVAATPAIGQIIAASTPPTVAAALPPRLFLPPYIMTCRPCAPRLATAMRPTSCRCLLPAICRCWPTTSPNRRPELTPRAGDITAALASDRITVASAPSTLATTLAPRLLSPCDAIPCTRLWRVSCCYFQPHAPCAHSLLLPYVTGLLLPVLTCIFACAHRSPTRTNTSYYWFALFLSLALLQFILRVVLSSSLPLFPRLFCSSRFSFLVSRNHRATSVVISVPAIASTRVCLVHV